MAATAASGASVNAAVADDFSAFWERERVALYRALALTLGDADLAAEAVDEAMARAFQRWSQISGYDRPAGWVYRVALNWARSRVRRHRRHAELAPRAWMREETEQHGATPELATALARLSAGQRAVVVLRFHLDWSLEEIATALEVPVGTVKSRLHRALATMRQRLAAGGST